LPCLSVALFSGSACAATIAGKWTGRMALDGSHLKKQLKQQSAIATGNKKKQIESRIRTIDQSIQMVAKSVIKLDLQKGGIAMLDFMRNGKSDPERGRWVQKGRKLFLLGLTGGGDTKLSLNGAVTEGGKTLLFDMSSMMEHEMSAKGLKSTVKPKLTLSFKKV
jgi:hypothetical protein